MNQHRFNVVTLLEDLAMAVRAESAAITDRAHKWLQPCLGRHNLAFMREVAYIVGPPDYTFLVDHVLGLPKVGWAQPAYGHTERYAPPLADVSFLTEGLHEHNAAMVRACKSTGDLALDAESWAKTCQEFQTGALLGPWYDLNDIPLSNIRLVPRHPLWEAHGGNKDKTCRNIDDMLRGGQNATTGTQHTHVPAYLDMLAQQVRTSTHRWPDTRLAGFPSDFAKAFRQQTAAPETAHLHCVVTWDADRKCQVYGVAVAQLFGGKAAPINFARIPKWCLDCLAVTLLVPATHCVDDVLCIERQATAMSAWFAWRAFANLCGWDVPDSKSPLPASAFRAVGAWLDLSALPNGHGTFRIAADRSQHLQAELHAVLEANMLPPGRAGQLYGKLGFASTQVFGMMGRAPLRPFVRRQHEHSRVGLNPQMCASIHWWLKELSVQRHPRTIPLNMECMDWCVSYSDGEGADAGVGVALWSSRLKKPVAGFLYVPVEVRNLWLAQRQRSDQATDIYEIEAVGPLLVLHHWPHILRDTLWIHYIDNAAAQSALVKGSSSVMSGDVIVHYTWSQVAALHATPWFDRVASPSNPVDGLSRGDMAGPWSLQDLHLPERLLHQLRALSQGPPQRSSDGPARKRQRKAPM